MTSHLYITINLFNLCQHFFLPFYTYFSKCWHRMNEPYLCLQNNRWYSVCVCVCVCVCVYVVGLISYLNIGTFLKNYGIFFLILSSYINQKPCHLCTYSNYFVQNYFLFLLRIWVLFGLSSSLFMLSFYSYSFSKNKTITIFKCF
jgi:hypothetical protein